MKGVRGIIYDCDGVLFDSREANRMYYNDLLSRFGREPMDEAELQYVHSHNAMDATRHIFRHDPAEAARAEMVRRGTDYTPYLRYMKMEKGLKEFLARIRPGLKTAISTNRTTTMPSVLAMSGLKDFFDMVVTALDVENPKPHPEAIEKILSHFGLEAGDGVYIGDSDVDEAHAEAAGMPLIAFRNRSLRAAWHIDSFADAMKLAPFEGL